MSVQVAGTPPPQPSPNEGVGVPPWSSPNEEGTPSQVPMGGTAGQALTGDTPDQGWTACLLRSRSGTFLYFDKFVKEVIYLRNRLGSFSVLTAIHRGSN